MNTEQLEYLSKLEQNEEVQQSLDAYKAEESRVLKKDNKSQNVLKSLSPMRVIKTTAPSSSSKILDKMNSSTSWADEVEKSETVTTKTRAHLPSITADPNKLSSIFKMEDAMEQFHHWESIFPDTRLTPFFSTHLPVISESILLVCAEDLQKTTVDTDTNWKDVQWFLILSGALAQSQNDSAKKSKEVLEELSRLLTTHKEDFVQVKAQQETLISGTKDIQIACEKTVSALSSLTNKLLTSPKPEPSKQSPYIPPPPPQLGSSMVFKYGGSTFTMILPSRGIQMHQSLASRIPDLKKFANGMKSFSESLLSKIVSRDLEILYTEVPNWSESELLSVL